VRKIKKRQADGEELSEADVLDFFLILLSGAPKAVRGARKRNEARRLRERRR
jgi:hypothetical protein